MASFFSSSASQDAQSGRRFGDTAGSAVQCAFTPLNIDQSITSANAVSGSGLLHIPVSSFNVVAPNLPSPPSAIVPDQTFLQAHIPVAVLFPEVDWFSRGETMGVQPLIVAPPILHSMAHSTSSPLVDNLGRWTEPVRVSSGSLLHTAGSLPVAARIKDGILHAAGGGSHAVPFEGVFRSASGAPVSADRSHPQYSPPPGFPVISGPILHPPFSAPAAIAEAGPASTKQWNSTLVKENIAASQLFISLSSAIREAFKDGFLSESTAALPATIPCHSTATDPKSME